MRWMDGVFTVAQPAGHIETTREGGYAVAREIFTGTYFAAGT